MAREYIHEPIVKATAIIIRRQYATTCTASGTYNGFDCRYYQRYIDSWITALQVLTMSALGHKCLYKLISGKTGTSTPNKDPHVYQIDPCSISLENATGSQRKTTRFFKIQSFECWTSDFSDASSLVLDWSFGYIWDDTIPTISTTFAIRLYHDKSTALCNFEYWTIETGNRWFFSFYIKWHAHSTTNDIVINSLI